MNDTDWRALCEELADALDHNRQCLLDDRRLTHPLADKARAALAAEPVSEAEQAMQLPEQAPDEHPPSNFDRREVAAWYHGHACGWQAARAVLARYGHQPAPPAEEEVAELVEWLRDDLELHPAEKRRAADLLEQRHPAPVPVSERLPGAEDCDENGDCWFDTGTDVGWMLCDKVFGLRHGSRWWLPFHALPLPQGEVK